MRIRVASAFGLQLFLLVSSFAEAQTSAPAPVEKCERLVEFRDGSILRVDLPSSYEFEFSKAGGEEGDGSGQPQPLRLDLPLGIRFSKVPALPQLQLIRRAIDQLQVDSFSLREQALRTLMTQSRGFRPLIEDQFVEIADPETRWRLATALDVLPSQPSIDEHAYDEIITADEIMKGDVSDWQIASGYRHTEVQLDRKHVRAIRQAPAIGQRGETPVIATTEPIRQDLDALFPDDCCRIDFEFDSMGEPLRPGQDISRRFIPDGVIITTSIEDSFFSVNDFAVPGRSRGQSGATHSPLFYGTLSMRFCVPGNENEPAGVTHVGLYAAIVQEGGTSLAAYDASGHRIATVTTKLGSHEFIGLRSNVPIHRIEIIPNKDIDPDVAIDDLVFSVPEGLDAGGSANGFTLDFASGERLVSGDFRIIDDNIIAQPSGKFSGEIVLPAGELVRLQTPANSHPENREDHPDTWFWVMLDDGSTLLAREGQGGDPPRTVLHGLPLDSLELAAIWSEHEQPKRFPAGLQLDEAQVAVIKKQEPALLETPTLTSNQFTAVDQDALVEWSYNRIPTIWLRQPNPAGLDSASGFIRLNTSERIILGDGSSFRLDSLDSNVVSLHHQGETFDIPVSRITSLYLPESN
ncbi:MAG: hypothetical protein ACR2RV_03320 [Verrucomicrobiales bacterium]